MVALPRGMSLPGAPAKPANGAARRRTMSFLIAIDHATATWLEAERARRGLRSRAALVRVLFFEARTGRSPAAPLSPPTGE